MGKEFIKKDDGTYILTDETLKKIVDAYPYRWVETMTSKPIVQRVCGFVERAKNCGIELTYTQAYFCPRGVYVLENGASKRVFDRTTDSPVCSTDAEDDWQEWVRKDDTKETLSVEGWNEILSRR